MTGALVVIAAVLLVWSTLALAYRKCIGVAWREPVLRAPVLIVESDDWGPGPGSDAARLRDLAELLGRHRDGRGRAAVATIGVVLSLPDAAASEPGAAGQPFRRLTFADPRFRAMREALLAGGERGVLALQLHGMEHYWPAALVEAAGRDPAVARWIARSPDCRTEDLPPALQMRWADAARLPSRPIPAGEIERAVHEEVAAFADALHTRPDVVVPPTFVWDAYVEAAWAKHGVRTVVTPGLRFVGRDSAGRLTPDPHCTPHNGGRGDSGVTYVVRDRYFEPGRGHRAEDGLRALADKTRAGRPTLLETHRSNFIGESDAAADAFAQLDRLLDTALKRFPDLRFISTGELAAALRSRDAGLVEERLAPRVHAWLVRLSENARLRKLSWATGLAIPAWLLFIATRVARPPADLDLHSQSSPG